MIDAKELRDGIAAVKQALQDLEARATDLRIERDAIEMTPPHPDDIAAWIRRGLDEAQQSFDSRMRSYFNEEFVRHQRGSFPATRTPPQLIGLPVTVAGRAGNGIPAVLDQRDGQADIATITVLLRPVIEKQIPHLVATYFPAATGELTAAERAAQMAEIDAKIADCESQMAAARETLREISESVMT